MQEGYARQDFKMDYLLPDVLWCWAFGRNYHTIIITMHYQAQNNHTIFGVSLMVLQNSDAGHCSDRLSNSYLTKTDLITVGV